MGWQECVNRLSGTIRTLPAFLGHKGDKSETTNFAKFPQSESDREMHVLQNGSAARQATSSVARDSSGWSSDGGGGGGGGDDWNDYRYVDELEEQDGQHVTNPRERITEWQAGWNVTNAIQGMFIVSFPYAVHQGGYWSIFAMVLVAYICCHTGQILVDCLYEPNPMGRLVRVRTSYVEIAEVVWGRRYGARLVNLAQIIELLMTCILYVLLCGDLIQGSFPDSPLGLTSWIMVSTVPLLACAFLTSLRLVSWLSFWCTVAHMLINLIILIYCFTRAPSWHWGVVKLRIDIWTLPIAMGIIVFSYTSQIFLPTLEGNLTDRSKFKCMMHWTHIAAAVFKALFSYIGFLTWGLATKEVITNNLPHPSFKIVVNLILVAKALLSYPLPFYAAVDLLQTAMFRDRSRPESEGGTWFPSCYDALGPLKVWGLALRLLLVLFTTVLAVIIPHFTLLMGLIGSFTGTMLSFVWPCYFHLKIKWYVLRWPARIVDLIIIFLGFLFGSVGMYYSAHALSRAYRGLPPEPIHS